jgi:glutaminyl-peptide cyclotransferase
MRQNPLMRRLFPTSIRGILPAGLALLLSACGPTAPRAFSGAEAYALAAQFLAFGPRVSGTEANRKAGGWIMEKLKAAGWNALADEGEYMATPIRNVFGVKGRGPIVIFGAHYDSRRCADQPAGGCAEPVLGADDGASGVAVLLELARTIDWAAMDRQVWLVFFDAEDNGGLNGWDWIAGSKQFALRVKETLAAGETVQAMVLLDMVGDADQQFYFEGNSDPALREEIWTTAAALGFGSYFVPSRKYIMLDDHLPFRDLGIPSVDIIDFDYPYWHTTQDTLDKISADSLEHVGRTMEVWLEGGG